MQTADVPISIYSRNEVGLFGFVARRGIGEWRGGPELWKARAQEASIEQGCYYPFVLQSADCVHVSFAQDRDCLAVE